MSSQALDNFSLAPDTPKQGANIDELIAQAETCISQSQFEEAKALYAKVLDSESHRAIANYGLGMIEANTTSVLEAIPYFESAIKSDPNNEQYWVSFIDAMLLSNQFDKARDAIELGQKYGLSSAFAEQLLSECNPQPESDRQPQAQHAYAKECQYSNFQQALGAMIALNKRMVSEFQVAKATGDHSLELSADVDFSPVEPFFNQWFADGHYQEILTISDAVISQLVQTPELVGYKIYTPFLDQLLTKYDYNLAHVVPRSQKSVNIVLASELYNYGGHTKEIATLLHNLDNPMLVVTDIYDRFAASKDYETISDMFPDCPVVMLPKEASLTKSKRLASLINKVARNVYLLIHHNDSAAVAACQPSIDVNYYFIHHGDHNASLGNYTEHFKHVDLFAGLAKNCSEDLNKPTLLLPTSTKDLGSKVFSDVTTSCATVTAGTFGKFKTEGFFSLSNIIIQSVKATQSPHYHFGTIPDADLLKIKQELINAGVDAQLFLYKGHVSSLWESLKSIDAHIFIGSAPVRGGKSEIEAQGVGYPLLLFKSLNCPRHLNIGSNAPETTYWHDLESFIDGLKAIRQNHTHLVASSREFYLGHCTPEQYQRALTEIQQ